MLKKLSGILYIVATPLGNLEDITLRAIRTLKEVDFIACEDTRTSSRLLSHYAISKPLLRYHDHNEVASAVGIVERIVNGESGALTTDAGTPLLSDPGFRLVRDAVAAGIRVVPIPGASALATAASAAGLPTERLLFAGFLPAKQGQRRKELEELSPVQATLVFYEAPHRILELLADIASVCGEAPVVLGRELTKLHEEFLRGTAAQVAATLAERETIRGEFTVLVGQRALAVPTLSLSEDIAQRIAQGAKEMDAIKAAAKGRGLGKRDAYAEYLKSAKPGPK